jgi:hypothetical protein
MLPIIGFVALVVVLVYWLVPLVAQRFAAILGLLFALGASDGLWATKPGFIGTNDVVGHAAREIMWWAMLRHLMCLATSSSYLSYSSTRGRPLRDPPRPTPASPPPGKFSAKLREQLLEYQSTDAQEAARQQLLNGCMAFEGPHAIAFLLGVLDRAAWWLAFDFGSWSETGIWLGISAAALRALLPFAAKLKGGGLGAAGLLKVGNLLGRVLTFALFAWWVAVVHKTAMASMFKASGSPDLAAAWVPAFVILSRGAFGIRLCYGWNVRFLNLSSLHGFIDLAWSAAIWAQATRTAFTAMGKHHAWVRPPLSRQIRTSIQSKRSGKSTVTTTYQSASTHRTRTAGQYISSMSV